MTNLLNDLKTQRNAQGMTQEALAKRVGVSRQTIIAIEKAKFVPSVKLALALAAALEVPLDRLFALEGTGETYQSGNVSPGVLSE